MPRSRRGMRARGTSTRQGSRGGAHSTITRHLFRGACVRSTVNQDYPHHISEHHPHHSGRRGDHHNSEHSHGDHHNSEHSHLRDRNFHDHHDTIQPAPSGGISAVISAVTSVLTAVTSVGVVPR